MSTADNDKTRYAMYLSLLANFVTNTLDNNPRTLPIAPPIRTDNVTSNKGSISAV